MKAFNLPAATKGRPTWASPDGEATFWSGEPFNKGSTWLGRFRGTSPWERHPDGDELLHVLEGEVDVLVLKTRGRTRVKLTAGSVFVVPRGHWHRHEAKNMVLECGATSGRTQHSTADDPRRSLAPRRPR
jgi:mannose-6-phosphate isomerase-like protein (cupin superfamily)